MNKFTAILMSAVIASLALAAPSTPLRGERGVSAAKEAYPVFNLSKDARMNLMLKNEVIQLVPSPEYKLTYWHINKTKATFIFQGGDVKELYDFYDQALGMEGWKDAPMMGLENGVMKDGSYAGTYALEEYILSFTVKASTGKTTVHFELK